MRPVSPSADVYLRVPPIEAMCAALDAHRFISLYVDCAIAPGMSAIPGAEARSTDTLRLVREYNRCHGMARQINAPSATLRRYRGDACGYGVGVGGAVASRGAFAT